jgi:hypothetical protein
VRFTRLFWLALLAVVTPAAAQPTGYTAPKEFMDLFFDFTGSNEQTDEEQVEPRPP